VHCGAPVQGGRCLSCERSRSEEKQFLRRNEVGVTESFAEPPQWERGKWLFLFKKSKQLKKSKKRALELGLGNPDYI